MTYEEFEKNLKIADIDKRQFAIEVSMNYTSVTNWSKPNKVPPWVESWLNNYIKAKNMDKIVDSVTPYIKKS